MPSLCSFSWLLRLSSSLLLLVDLTNSLQLYRAILASTKFESKHNQDFIQAVIHQQQGVGQQQLRREDVEAGQVVFGINAASCGTGNNDSYESTSNSLSFLNYLAVSRLRIVVSTWRTNHGNDDNDNALFRQDHEVDEQLHSHDNRDISRVSLIDEIESALSLWKQIGNSIQANDDASDVGFSLTTSSLKMSSRLRRQKKLQMMHNARDKLKHFYMFT